MYTKKILTTKEIGEKIKNRRRELKISQEDLSEILNVTYQQIQRYENGTNKLNVENLQAIAEALSVPVLYFFETEMPSIVAETLQEKESLPVNELRLLRYFRKIKNNQSRNVVIKVARLAAK